MCDSCKDLLDLLLQNETQLAQDSGDEEKPLLKKEQVEKVFLYLQAWSQRQCSCCFKDSKNFDRFHLITQSLVCLAVAQLKAIPEQLGKAEDRKLQKLDGRGDIGKTDIANKDERENKLKEEESECGAKAGEVWSLEEKERLLHLVSKVFLLNFPLYVAYKHSVHSKYDEVSQQEASSLSVFCDIHDPEIPVYLLRNVCLFCKSGGIHAMTACFEDQNPDILLVSLAHAIVGVISNVKLWLNYRSIIQLFIPLRSKVLRYMCKLADKDLRAPGIKSMAEFMWTAVKDPLDAPLTFDKDGLDLAFKYFTSTTLTMRLSGVSQINNHINMYSELCNNEAILEADGVGRNLAEWLLKNQVIEHIFGPNLHVEVIKQSHVILSFLAMEGKITNDHIHVIWQSAQLKHCSKQVFDLLPPLIKNLEAGPLLHLYQLLCALEPREHTEQSLYLASSLIKLIWTNGDSYCQILRESPNMALLKSQSDKFKGSRQEYSSSENSVSMEASNSEEEEEEDEEEEEEQQHDSSQPSEINRTQSEASEGPMFGERLQKKQKCFKKSLPKAIEEVGKDEFSDDSIEEPKGGNSAPVIEKKIAGNEPDQSLPKEKRASPELTKLAGETEAKSCVETACSDSDADAEKSGGEEASKPARRKVLRKRKRLKVTKAKNDPPIGKMAITNLSEQLIREKADAAIDVEVVKDEGKDQTKKEVIQVDDADQAVPNVVLRHGENEFMPMLEQSQDSSQETPQGAVITELASLVRFSSSGEVTPLIRPFHQSRRELLEDAGSGEEGSYSSRMSNKSDKNMADFDGEESGCDDELAQLAAHAQLAGMASMYPSRFHTSSSKFREALQSSSRLSSHFKLENVCKPGNTLLWDLLQDNQIMQLSEGLSLEAEKALCNLVCFNTDKVIRMKFIEGCLENLAHNRSVVVSLRLLPKLFASFQQLRMMDTHAVTLWADKEMGMMNLFFNNLKTYVEQGPRLMCYSHQVEVQVRLQFLTSVFSTLGSPESFQLDLEQVDVLWACLATDHQCSDELFSWLLSQAKNKEQHALGVDCLKHLYLRKLPSLPPESISMTGLTLFQQLFNLARLAQSHSEGVFWEADAVGMDHLWQIAVRATNTDVSMTAIQYLNCYYIGKQLEHEEEFVNRCMESLAAATKDISENEESSLLRIHRALVLLKSHLETFRRRYAYHLRRWALEGQGIGSHAQLVGERGAVPLRVMVQPAGMAEKVSLELLSSDYVADLRAEVTKWWEALQASKSCGVQSSSTSEKVSATPVLGSLLTEGPLRMISQGQELTAEFDEKTLDAAGFKDLQLVFISMGVSRPQKKRDVTTVEVPSVLPPPPRECIPMNLLLCPQYFEQLFGLMQALSSMKSQDKAGNVILHTKAQVLSRRVWDILMLLPTSPSLLEGFRDLGPGSQTRFEDLLNPASPQKLMYSLYIVESLGRQAKKTDISTAGDETSWSNMFLIHGGLQHLFDIFLSGILQSREGDDWSEWQQDCLASLLKLLCQYGVAPEEMDVVTDQLYDLNETSRKKTKRYSKSSTEKLLIPRLNEKMLAMMDVQNVMPRLTSILYESSLPRDPNHYKTGFWGRAQVVHYALALLISWAYCCEEVQPALFACPKFPLWLHRLVLEDPEPPVRQETCTSLYRLCLGSTNDGKTGTKFIAPMLSHLLECLPAAQKMRPPKQLETPHHTAEEGKEPYGPACRDYFWLLCRLLDSLAHDHLKEGIDEAQGCVVDINSLVKRLACAVVTHEYFETKNSTVEDSCLVGLLNATTLALKHNPPFKASKEGQAFLHQVFDCLFALPSPYKRYLPKCKSQMSRSAAYDLLVEMVKGAPVNYHILHGKLLAQHQPNSSLPDTHPPYPWDYWPHEDGRSDCGYVGLTNLGATCYMASCMQHLYMMPQARASILKAKCNKESKHEQTLGELQRMFAYLLESERKAYNPRSFCKVYTMDHQPLNTGEQKDMAEFFIDLVSKLEEMTPELKSLVKNLFGGVQSNNVVSLDCPHVSRTLEEFYTVRCQVADMRNLYESLNEVTVKDTLEGDNMYTCSQCGKKVRAEKRACFKKLPHILCFNTMRYTFNMVTMLKEKVNTHFSFPLRLDMSSYIEKHLMPQQYQEEKMKRAKQERVPGQDDSETEEFGCEYDLIGVTVHTGTADGGHYYSFIRDRTSPNKEWFLFNDAEVKPFDPNQIAAECFGGEMMHGEGSVGILQDHFTTLQSKTYDSVTDKFMDFSFEKTNSAYMLFYERCNKDDEQGGSKNESEVARGQIQAPLAPLELSKELEDWIWQDNMQFLRDKNIFEHTYFHFMWQMCGYVPQTLVGQQDVTVMAAKLSTSFFLETFIHAKEKPTMVQWVELLTKQFNASQAACEWFMDHMAADEWWPVQILIKCPNQMVRQMFQRLCIHVIQRLRSLHAPLYLKPSVAGDDPGGPVQIGAQSCVTRFIRKLLLLMEQGAKSHIKHLTEYFTFLHEFSKMGEEECRFLISVEAISRMVNFYLGQKNPDVVEVVSEEEEEEEDVISLPTDKYKPASLDKMITLITTLVEKSRREDHRLHLSTSDLNAVAGGKGFPFLYQQIRDNINLPQTRNLIYSLCRWNDKLAVQVVNMMLQAITKHSELSQPFFKLLTLLTELVAGPAGLICFTQLVLQRVWEVADFCPQATLDWLAVQVPRNKLAHSWVLQSMDNWVEHFLIAHANQRVRNAAAYLLVSLVPNMHFRQGYRATRSLGSPHKDLIVSPEAQMVLHQIYDLLLRLLKPAKHYTDIPSHGTTKLTAYFALLTYCVVSRTEKLKFGQHFLDLWQLFHPKLSEPSIPVHHNKQALLLFWHHVCTDCPENVKLILQNAHVTKNIAFNYILADHEDQDVVIFNRAMLPAYYGLLRLCCQQSRTFTRQLASHQNIHWAFKNITPYPTQYSGAVEELFKLMHLFVMKHTDSSEQELHEINAFRRQTLQLYLQALDARSCWATLISALRILIDSSDDRLFVAYSGGMQMLFEAFHTLHVMYHEATACHVLGDLLELLVLILDMIKCLRFLRDNKDAKNTIMGCKEWIDTVRKLATMLNSYNPPDLRNHCIEVLKELLLLIPGEVLQILVPLLAHCHVAYQENQNTVPLGPYFPRREQKSNLTVKAATRPQRPMVQMAVPQGQLEACKGVDEDYDLALVEYFNPYHQLVDVMCRLAINNDCMSEALVNLSALIGYEEASLHMTFFAKLWLDIYNAQHVDRKYISMLLSNSYFIDYVETVLLEERPCLNISVIYNFLTCYFPKVAAHVLNDQTCQLVPNLSTALSSGLTQLDTLRKAYNVNGDLRALLIVQNCGMSVTFPEKLFTGLQELVQHVKAALPKEENPAEEPPAKKHRASESSKTSTSSLPTKEMVSVSESPPSSASSSSSSSCSTSSSTSSSPDSSSPSTTTPSSNVTTTITTTSAQNTTSPTLPTTTSTPLASTPASTISPTLTTSSVSTTIVASSGTTTITTTTTSTSAALSSSLPSSGETAGSRTQQSQPSSARDCQLASSFRLNLPANWLEILHNSLESVLQKSK